MDSGNKFALKPSSPFDKCHGGTTSVQDDISCILFLNDNIKILYFKQCAIRAKVSKMYQWLINNSVSIEDP